MIAPSEDLLPFLDRRLTSGPLPLAFRPPFASWQREVRGLWRATLPPHGAARTLSQTGPLLRLRYPTGDDGDAYFACPPGPGPHPAVLLMHDHGGSFGIGWQKLVHCPDNSDSAQTISRLYDGRALANWLLAQGFAVFAADALGWGSRFTGGYDQQQALAAQAMQVGWSLAGLVAADDLATFEWLAAHPQVDGTRIATMGFSFGAFRAWQLAALAPSVRATVAVGWMGTRKGLLSPGNSMLRGQSAFYTLHPQLAARLDIPDMAGLALDRPVFIATGVHDKHFPPAAAQPAFDRLHHIAASTATTVHTEFYDGAHTFPIAVQDRGLALLRSHFG